MPLQELEHKRRSVSDLIRYVRNTTEIGKSVGGVRTPNYSILLGSGASITSGIRSGQQLIKKWKEEIYHENVTDPNTSIDQYFSSDAARKWYDESRAYSSLFENRFDLQRHRRIFVENEVAGKTPSIGYAYLVKLIESGYFNTVFTTNFDDLLNEAFYRFSKNRPLICAHDSSISGVTVTSKRPKIIKLHGDYLFDDIKTTMRETESLENNMKLKFQEFAKDFGLIVVGYSGGDRSIMDILSFLLQHDDYFKNGIYWCIRKGDNELTPDLKKLLWKERVFFVEIDGFDDLFAEMNHALNDGALPVDDMFLSWAHQETIIKELTENPRLSLNDKSSYLFQDCVKLRQNFENNMAMDFIKHIREKNLSEDYQKPIKNRNSRKNPFGVLSSEERKELQELTDNAFLFGQRSSVLQDLSQRNILSLERSRYKLELLELYIDLSKNLTDEEIKMYFDELINLDPYNERHYAIASNRSNSINQKLDFLSRACKTFENDYYIINLYCSHLLDYCQQNSIANDYYSRIKDLGQYISKSLELNPDIRNEAYIYKARFILLSNRNDTKKRTEQRDSLCDIVSSKNILHPVSLGVLRILDSDKLTEDLIKDALEFYEKADNDECVERIYVEYIKMQEGKGKVSDVLKIFEEYESKYNSSQRYKDTKAQFLMDHEYLEDSLDLFLSNPNDDDNIKKAMTILSYLERHDELEKLYHKCNRNNILYEHYLSVTNNYEELVEFYSKNHTEINELTIVDINSHAYALLQLKKYQEVKKLLKPYYEKHNADAATIVNYQYADLQLNKDNSKKVKTKIEEKILKNKFIEFSDLDKLGANCVIGDSNEVLNCLSKAIKKEPITKYVVKNWPVLQPYLSDSKISKLMNPSSRRLKS